jgi:hypothetical protein
MHIPSWRASAASSGSETPECLAERGCFLIGCNPTDKQGDIRLGFFTSQEHDPAKLTAFSDSESAMQEFEKDLTERGFIPTSDA